MFMPQKPKDSVVVITGASSGIGRATALAFSGRGATVVLAARRKEVLQEVASDCERMGGRALIVPTDVTENEAVRNLARQAIENFGRIDVWVNNAAVTVFGRFEEIPIDTFERVLQTNIFGYIYGSRAVLPYFREQGSGVLINVSSIVGKLPQPFTSPYVLSKHAIRALGLCLRQELALDGAKDIHVCTVLPATIDTPLFQHAANYTGRTAIAMPPVYPAENVAKTILQLSQSPKREVFVGNSGRMLSFQHKLAPALIERMYATMVDRMHLTKGPAPQNSGNVFEPMFEGTGVSGGWRASRASRLGKMALSGFLFAGAFRGLRPFRNRRAIRE
jgi:NAD(P)-dependent dehydrogenase (short-subunit alcohol dehydrogenase family)